MQKTICDLCKREISEFGESEMRIFKIKEYRGFGGFAASWDRIDAHQACVRKLFYAAKSKTPAVPVGWSSMQDE